MSAESTHKQKGIGQIPIEWKIFKLGDVADVSGGATPSTYVPHYWNGEIPFVTPTDVTNLKGGNILTSTEKSITKAGFDSISAKYVPAGSVLVTSRATIGVCCINSIPVVTNQGFVNLICRDELYNLHALYLMRSLKKELERLSGGTTFKELARGSIGKISIALPPKSEQRKISSILSCVDETIAGSAALVEKYTRIKQGLMQDLLRLGINNHGNIRSEETHQFKDSPVGRIPSEWNVRKASEELYMKGRIGWQGLKKSEFLEDGNYLVTGIHFTERNTVDWDKCFRISDFRYNQAPEIQLRLNDVLITKDGTIGKIAYIDYLPGKASLNSHLLVLRPTKSNLLSRYLYYQLLSDRFRHFIETIKTGSTLAGLTQSNFGTFDLIIPDIDEQSRIIMIMSEIDSTIQNEEAYEEKLLALKRGLMTDLLTGRTRMKEFRDRDYAAKNHWQGKIAE